MVAEPTYLTPGVVLQDRYEIADEIGRRVAALLPVSRRGVYGESAEALPEGQSPAALASG